ncbi:hypothetical protein H4W80_002059 [Nonomuraea angiospora]|uniref:Uncharacterized protein n=1 Tax=Nonomuraea angiospora TaxID=46172 RepID=A0ABR9LT17_9ACTN|nr:hypothetical protein [Nonomuraea angiospora]
MPTICSGGSGANSTFSSRWGRRARPPSPQTVMALPFIG